MTNQPFPRTALFSMKGMSKKASTLGLLMTTLVMGSGLATQAIASPQPSTAFSESNTLDVFSGILSDANAPELYSQVTDGDSSAEDAAADGPRFTCQYNGEEFVVMYSPEDDPDEFYEWATPEEMGGGWTPERRCNAISDRLESYRPDGLQELQTGTENGYNIVCATTSADPSCRIVFTVPEGQDPEDTRDLVFENLAVANSGQDTQGIRTFQGNTSTGSILEQLGSEIGLDLPSLPRSLPSLSQRRDSIDLRPFLSPADGGTGAAL